MSGILIIDNVDLPTLDEQRTYLVSLLESVGNGKAADPIHIHAVDGILNMLDAWSDDRAASDGSKHRFVVEISGCSPEEARQIMAVRMANDEGHVDDYSIDWRCEHHE